MNDENELELNKTNVSEDDINEINDVNNISEKKLENNGMENIPDSSFDNNVVLIDDINKDKKEKIPFKRVIGEAAIFGLTASVVFLATSSIGNYCLSKKSNSIEPVTTYVSESKDSNSGTSSIVDEAMKSIVSISTTQQINYQFYGYDSSYESEGAGSGVIIGKSDSELMIITNNHVISEADTINVNFCDGVSVEGDIKGVNNSADLAIVAVSLENIEQSTLNSIKVAVIGDSDSIKAGDEVIAIGNALGYGQSVTKGIVSALDKSVKSSDEEEMTGLIQTDAAINPGNSGGALLNSNGELIGINVAKYSGDTIEGIGFAIPITSSNDVIEDLMSRETRHKVSDSDRGYLQVSVSEVSEEANEIYGIPVGVYIQDVIKDGAADKAGIKAGDVIIEFNGVDISSYDDLQTELSYFEAGEETTLKIKTVEDGEWVSKDISVVLGSKIDK